MEYVLQTSGLTKMFKHKAAVDKVNLNVKKGDIYGFIGKNGAGKTTFIRMVAGLAKPTQGSIRLFESEDLVKQRKRTGTMIENPAVFPHLTARQNLQYYCLLLGLDAAKGKTINDMLELVGLSGVGKKKAKNFSLGMKQRLAIAIAMLDDPEFLMLDEPINGLDPSGIKETRELLQRLNQEKNITILISSHILGELSKLANRYGVINEGVLIDEFTSEELQNRCVGELEIKVDNSEKAGEILNGILEPGKFGIFDPYTLRTTEVSKSGQIITALAQNGVIVTGSTVVGQDLEGYFLYLMNSIKHNNE